MPRAGSDLYDTIADIHTAVVSIELGFLLIPQFSSLAFFCAVEPLRVANRLAGRALYTWLVFSGDGEPVAASNNMRVVADGRLSADSRAGTIIVCAGFDPLGQAGPRLPALLRRLAARGVSLGALDTGAFILARAGLVGAVPITMHWEAAPAFREAFPGLPVSSKLFEDSGQIFTCAGGTAALDLMLSRIAREQGATLAHAVSEQFIHDRIRPAGGGQRMAVRRRLDIRNALVARAAGLMEQELEQPLDITALASRLGVTGRQVERLFRTHLQAGPAAYHRSLRLARARSLLRQTDLAVIEIAAATGFGSRSAFSRSYRRAYAVSPGQDRREA